MWPILPKLHVMKIGHRPERDKRIAMHCALVSRAFGAAGITFDFEDKELKARAESVSKRFGGQFSIETGVDWKNYLKSWKNEGGEIIHLTMYGVPIQYIISEIRLSQKDKLIVVGGQKVPHLVYELADYNISITQQPHSEVAAICIFLDRYFEGAEFNRKFDDAELRIVPQRMGKLVVKEK
jgi:tRNA (cytidine56-2'-O)-methyltransferase